MSRDRVSERQNMERLGRCGTSDGGRREELEVLDGPSEESNGL